MNKFWNWIDNVLKFIFIKLLHLKFLEPKWDAFMQFVKFGLVGVSNTVISYLLYTFSLLGMRAVHIFPTWDYFIAQIIAFILSVLWSFFWNNKFVFMLEDGEERSLWKVLLKTYVSYSFTGLFLNSVLIVLWVQVLHISEFIAPIINLLISVPVNFIINKFWAFKNE